VLEKAAGKKRRDLERWFAGPEGPQALFNGRVLAFDEKRALVWRRLMGKLQKSCKKLCARSCKLLIINGPMAEAPATRAPPNLPKEPMLAHRRQIIAKHEAIGHAPCDAGQARAATTVATIVYGNGASESSS
jgi:hypothetical protein